MSIRHRFEFVVLALLAMPASGALAAAPAPEAATAQSALAKYRERFKLGMDRYKAGAVAEAVEYWEPIYGDLGPTEGYRLAYNLGLAYAELGDTARAAARLRSFLGEIDARRTRGERLEPLVMKEEGDARTRLTGLVVDAGTPSSSGATGETGPAVAPQPASAPAPAPGPALPMHPDVPARPFHPALFYVSGGLVLAAAVAAVALEANANTLRNRFIAEHDATGTIPQQDRDTFDSARTWSYVAVGGAIGCTAITAALVTWYVVGTPRHETPVVAVMGAGRTGGSLGLRGAF
jgi:hypothetical protein